MNWLVRVTGAAINSKYYSARRDTALYTVGTVCETGPKMASWEFVSVAYADSCLSVLCWMLCVQMPFLPEAHAGERNAGHQGQHTGAVSDA